MLAKCSLTASVKLYVAPDYELGDFVLAMDEMSKSLTEDLTGKGTFLNQISWINLRCSFLPIAFGTNVQSMNQVICPRKLMHG